MNDVAVPSGSGTFVSIPTDQVSHTESNRTAKITHDTPSSENTQAPSTSSAEMKKPAKRKHADVSKGVSGPEKSVSHSSKKTKHSSDDHVQAQSPGSDPEATITVMGVPSIESAFCSAGYSSIFDRKNPLADHCARFYVQITDHFKAKPWEIVDVVRNPHHFSHSLLENLAKLAATKISKENASQLIKQAIANRLSNMEDASKRRRDSGKLAEMTVDDIHAALELYEDSLTGAERPTPIDSHASTQPDSATLEATKTNGTGISTVKGIAGTALDIHQSIESGNQKVTARNTVLKPRAQSLALIGRSSSILSRSNKQAGGDHPKRAPSLPVAGIGAKEVAADLRHSPPLAKVAEKWGIDKIEHYGWARKGQKYCTCLGGAVNRVPDWSEAVTKLNQLIRRRVAMNSPHPTRLLVNPIDQIDLENLKMWETRDPYTKRADNRLLKFEKLVHAPNGYGVEYGFDKYGLLVGKEFAVKPSQPVERVDPTSHKTQDSHEPTTSPPMARNAPSSIPHSSETSQASQIQNGVNTSKEAMSPLMTTVQSTGLNVDLDASLIMLPDPNTDSTTQMSSLIMPQQHPNSRTSSQDTIPSLDLALLQLFDQFPTLKAAFEKRERKIQELESQAVKDQTEIQELKYNIEFISPTADAQSLYDSFKARVTELDNQIGRLQNQLQMKERYIEELQRTDNNLLLKNERLDFKLTEKEDQISRLKEEHAANIGEMESRIEKIYTELESEQQKVQVRYKELESSRASLEVERQTVITRDKHVENLTASLESERRKVETQEKELQKLKANIEAERLKLKSKLVDTEKLQADLASYSVEMQRKDGNIEKLNAELISKRAELTRKDEEVKEAQANLSAKLEAAQNESRRLKTSLNSAFASVKHRHSGQLDFDDNNHVAMIDWLCKQLISYITEAVSNKATMSTFSSLIEKKTLENDSLRSELKNICQNVVSSTSFLTFGMMGAESTAGEALEKVQCLKEALLELADISKTPPGLTEKLENADCIQDCHSLLFEAIEEIEEERERLVEDVEERKKYIAQVCEKNDALQQENKAISEERDTLLDITSTQPGDWRELVHWVETVISKVTWIKERGMRIKDHAKTQDASHTPIFPTSRASAPSESQPRDLIPRLSSDSSLIEPSSEPILPSTEKALLSTSDNAFHAQGLITSRRDSSLPTNSQLKHQAPQHEMNQTTAKSTSNHQGDRPSRETESPRLSPFQLNGREQMKRWAHVCGPDCSSDNGTILSLSQVRSKTQGKQPCRRHCPKARSECSADRRCVLCKLGNQLVFITTLQPVANVAEFGQPGGIDSDREKNSAVPSSAEQTMAKTQNPKLRETSSRPAPAKQPSLVHGSGPNKPPIVSDFSLINPPPLSTKPLTAEFELAQGANRGSRLVTPPPKPTVSKELNSNVVVAQSPNSTTHGHHVEPPPAYQPTYPYQHQVAYTMQQTQTHISSNLIKCPHCHMFCPDLQLLDEHMRNSHPNRR